MKWNTKSLFTYLISVSISALLFWYVYKDQNLAEMLERVGSADLKWVLVSIVISMFSHLSRGIRWKIALKPLGYNVNTIKVFMAVVVGYFVNNLVPRMGEMARCGLLKKGEGVPIRVSFGAVAAERALDLILLVGLIATVLILEFNKIGVFLSEKLTVTGAGMLSKLILLGGVGVFLIVFALILYFQRHRLQSFTVYQKVGNLLSGFKEGLLSILKLSAVDRFYYIMHTLLIWVAYYFMAYVMFFCTPETSILPPMTALTVLIMGGIGMAIPTPGGTGSYHLFVTATLLAYGISEPTGKYFAFLLHSSQVLSQIIFGSLFLLISLLWSKKPAYSNAG
ncbi:lysylphosphatidylglycerol synthase transmembrane domain-containing protein [Rapidithrix thailandica]|uniref:Lysylphosphatidylglycerol synthase transmembrane domain-containing protein n=1 Tax=Rapidithrix thailandica TaxID=413964 RepID=A0AAW9S626_9BACT